MEVSENRTVTQYLVVVASVQGRRKRLYASGVEGRVVVVQVLRPEIGFRASARSHQFHIAVI